MHYVAAVVVLILMALSHLSGVVLERRRDLKLALRYQDSVPPDERGPGDERYDRFHGSNAWGR